MPLTCIQSMTKQTSPEVSVNGKPLSWGTEVPWRRQKARHHHCSTSQRLMRSSPSRYGTSWKWVDEWGGTLYWPFPQWQPLKHLQMLSQQKTVLTENANLTLTSTEGSLLSCPLKHIQYTCTDTHTQHTAYAIHSLFHTGARTKS